MAKAIEMPKLSDTMTDGVIASWNKKVGDKVKAGELLAEIETDKATMEMEAFYDGILLYIGVEKGAGIPVGSLMAIIGNAGEEIESIIAKYKSPATVVAAEPEKKAVAEAGSEKVVAVATALVAPVTENGNGDSRVKASPLAKALAKEKGVALTHVPGSGEGGRIVKRDIESFIETGGGQSAGRGMAVGTESFHEVPVSQMRKTIARRLVESKNNAPHFYLTMEIDMSEAVKAREAINESAPSKISFNDLVIKAVASALRRHPAVNSSWLGDKIRYNDHIHIGMAVAVEDGLIVPVIRFADAKSLSAIAEETRSLADKAKNKKLQPPDWEGNTFTISNLGMFGIDEFTAIINPPDACILAVGGIADKPVVKNGAVIPGKVMKVTLSCDHRAVDGAVGSAFLKTLKSYLENPVRMLI
jgi:pyruvate dehydrogenase E2 component (dihydrolipoamide acetyltransferase)